MLDSVWLGDEEDSERYLYWFVVPVSLYIARWILFGGGRLLYSQKGFGATTTQGLFQHGGHQPEW
jgi:hypothetical protein